MASRTTDKFHYQVVDLDKNPARAQSLGVRDYGVGVARVPGQEGNAARPDRGEPD